MSTSAIVGVVNSNSTISDYSSEGAWGIITVSSRGVSIETISSNMSIAVTDEGINLNIEWTCLLINDLNIEEYTISTGGRGSLTEYLDGGT